MRFFLGCFILLFFLSCEKNTTGLQKKSTPTDWSRFIVQMVDYDTLQLHSENQIRVAEKWVDRIIFAEPDSGSFTTVDTLFPSYQPVEDEYYLNFDYLREVPRKSREYRFRLLFQKENELIARVDSLVLTYKFPYPTAEIFLTTEQIFTDFEISVQDFVLAGDKLFFHPLGPLGLYEYNFSTARTRELVSYPSGDFIAATGDYVFYQTCSIQINRYNLATDTTDLSFDFQQLDILGMAAEADTLYVLFYNPPADFLARFTLDGQLLTQILWPEQSFYLDIKDGFAWSRVPELRLLHFDLEVQYFLPSYKMPTNEGDGIRVDGEYLYYADYFRRTIGRVPLADLVEE